MKIIISYWAGSKYDNLPWGHQQEFKYSEEKRNKIINITLSKGYYIMLSQKEDLHIYIDHKRLGYKVLETDKGVFVTPSDPVKFEKTLKDNHIKFKKGNGIYKL